MATFDLPAVDSDVNVFVTVTNIFGTGGDSDVLVDKISELPMYIHMYVRYSSTITSFFHVWLHANICV